MERSSIPFDGIGASLLATYTTTANTLSSSGFDCSQYERINCYMTSASRASAGIVKVCCDYSDDNATWHPLYYLSSGTTTLMSYQIDADQSWFFSFPTAGRYARIRVVWVSGTSIAISKADIEAKS
jgi:hypothetical protein